MPKKIEPKKAPVKIKKPGAVRAATSVASAKVGEEENEEDEEGEEDENEDDEDEDEL
jgi:ribosomal protein L12E/L44/L45/RPP1/RPP2